MIFYYLKVSRLSYYVLIKDLAAWMWALFELILASYSLCDLYLSSIWKATFAFKLLSVAREGTF